MSSTSSRFAMTFDSPIDPEFGLSSRTSPSRSSARASAGRATSLPPPPPRSIHRPLPPASTSPKPSHAAFPTFPSSSRQANGRSTSPSTAHVNDNAPHAPQRLTSGHEQRTLLAAASSSSSSSLKPVPGANDIVIYYDSTASTSEDDEEDSRALRLTRRRRSHASTGAHSQAPSGSAPPRFNGARARSFESAQGGIESTVPPSVSSRDRAAPSLSGAQLAKLGPSALPISAPRLSPGTDRQRSDASRSSALANKGKTLQSAPILSRTGLGLGPVEVVPEWERARRELLVTSQNGSRLDRNGVGSYTSDLGSGISSQTSSSLEQSPVPAQQSTMVARDLAIPDFETAPPLVASASPPLRPARSTRFLPDQVERHERGVSHPAGRYASGMKYQDVDLQPGHIVFPTSTPAAPTRRSRSPSSISSRRSSIATTNTPIFSVVSHATTSFGSPHNGTPVPSLARPSSIRSDQSSHYSGRNESHKLYFPPPPPKVASPSANNSSLVFPSAPRHAPRSPDPSHGGLYRSTPEGSPETGAKAFPRALAASLLREDDHRVFPSARSSPRSSNGPFPNGSSSGLVFPTAAPFQRRPTSQRTGADGETGDELDLMIRAQRKVPALGSVSRLKASRSPQTSVYDDLLDEGEKVDLKVPDVDLSAAHFVPTALEAARPRTTLSSRNSVEEVSHLGPAATSRQRTISNDTNRSSVASDASDYFDASEISPRTSLDLDRLRTVDGETQSGVVPWLNHSTSIGDNMRRMSAIGEEAEDDVEDGGRRSPNMARVRTSPRNSKNLTILPPNEAAKVNAIGPVVRDRSSNASVTPPPKSATSALAPAPTTFTRSAPYPASMPSTPNRPTGLQSQTSPTPGRSLYSHSNSSSLSTHSIAPSVAQSTRSQRSIGRRIGNLFSGGSSPGPSSPRSKSFGGRNGALNMVGISSDAVRAAGLFQDDAAEVLDGVPGMIELSSPSSTTDVAESTAKMSSEVTQLESLFARFEREQKERIRDIAAQRSRTVSQTTASPVLA